MAEDWGYICFGAYLESVHETETRKAYFTNIVFTQNILRDGPEQTV